LTAKRFWDEKGYSRVKQLPLYMMILWTALLLCSPTAFAQEYSLRDLYAEAVKNSEKIKYAEENLYREDG